MVEKETVVVDNGERRTHSGWIVALIVLVLFVLFYMFGGFSAFGGGLTGPSTGTNVTTPTTSAPTTGQ